jgi:hypothetical protein
VTKKPQNKPENSGNDRDEKGRLLPGNKVSQLGGRKKGTPNFSRICKDKAEELGLSLEDLLWKVAETLFNKAIALGDVQAAKLLIDKICGESPTVTIDARSVNVGEHHPMAGPPIPSRQEMVQYLNELAATSARLAQVENEVDFPTNPGKPKGKPGHNGGKT